MAYDHHAGLNALRRALGTGGIEDHFTFDLGETTQEMQGAPDGTVRVRVTARLAGLIFSEFHIDLSSGDAVVGPPELLQGSNLLSFAGIQPVRFSVYPVAQPFSVFDLERSKSNLVRLERRCRDHGTERAQGSTSALPRRTAASSHLPACHASDG